MRQKPPAHEHEIGPDQKTENSGGNEHFRYCTALEFRTGFDYAVKQICAVEASRRLFGNSHCGA